MLFFSMNHCDLCGLAFTKKKIIDGAKSFCCVGCQAVFSILSLKNELEQFQDHPIFRQAVQSGLISNPELLTQITKKEALEGNERVRLVLEIEDLWCPFCAEIIKWMLLKNKGVIAVVVDYSTDFASIEFCPRFISKAEILSQIKTLSYTPHTLDDLKAKDVSKKLWIRFLVAAFLSLNIMMLAYPLYATYFDATSKSFGKIFALSSFVLSLPVITWCAYPIWKRLFNGLKVRLIGMEALVFLGVFAALVLSLLELFQGGTKVYFDSMTVIITFILLGKMIESKGKFSAKEAVFRLMRSTPRRGRKLFFDGRYQFIPTKEFSLNDQIAVFEGEKVVLDGVVEEGRGAIDESLMTGESTPVLKRPGDLLLAGTIVQSGKFIYRVTALEDKTALHKIMEVVQQEIGHKTAYVRAADLIVYWFVPLVLFIAMATVFIAPTDGVLRGISVLLISCPCALGIAAPLAESNTLNRLASMGAIVRNRGVLQLLGKETLFVFDKTGTLTHGRFKVLSDLPIESRPILKALVSSSNHPISRAISEAILEPPLKLEKIEEMAGLGLVGNDCYLLGSSRLFQMREMETPLVKSEHTVVFFYDGKEVTPVILGDEVKPDAKETVLSLHPAKTLLLSGDGKKVVEHVAKVCSIDNYRALCSPLEKREVIEEERKKGGLVCMVGDGINDAPALTQADIGISVVSAQEISIQASDLLLTTDRLSILSDVIKTARWGRHLVKQNLFWAFFYNLIGIPMAVFGLLSPIYAAIAMVLSSLIVLFNSGRKSS